MRYAWPVLAIFAGRFFAAAAFFPPGDGDLAWQRWLGVTIRTSGRLPRALGAETFTAAGAPWVPQEWLFSIAASFCTGPLWYVLAASAAVCATAALLIGVLRAVRTGATPVALVAVVLCAGGALCESFGVRVQIFALPLLALFLLLLECDTRVAYGAILVAAIWSNVHASVMLAPALALASAAGSFLDERFSARTKRTVLIAVGSLAATCCNPLGLALPRYAILLFSNPFKNMIVEWQHTDLSDPSFAFGALPLLLALIAFGIGGAHRWRDRCLVIVTTLLMFSAVRNVPVFAIACFPIVVRALCAGVPFFAAREPTAETTADRYAARLMPVFSVLLAVVVAGALARQSPHVAAANDKLDRTLIAVAGLPGTHRVLCTDFAWCSLLIGNPRDSVFLDGRADPYPAAVWTDFATVVRVERGWDTTLRSRGTDVVMAGVPSPLEQVLERSNRWRSVYRNDAYSVWTARSAGER